jgi:chromosome segregation ATPase
MPKKEKTEQQRRKKFQKQIKEKYAAVVKGYREELKAMRTQQKELTAECKAQKAGLVKAKKEAGDNALLKELNDAMKQLKNDIAATKKAKKDKVAEVSKQHKDMIDRCKKQADDLKTDIKGLQEAIKKADKRKKDGIDLAKEGKKKVFSNRRSDTQLVDTSVKRGRGASPGWTQSPGKRKTPKRDASLGGRYSKKAQKKLSKIVESARTSATVSDPMEF